MSQEFSELQQTQVKLVASEIYKYNAYTVAYATLKNQQFFGWDLILQQVYKMNKNEIENLEGLNATERVLR